MVVVRLHLSYQLLFIISYQFGIFVLRSCGDIIGNYYVQTLAAVFIAFSRFMPSGI